jgi:hypothetical protein
MYGWLQTGATLKNFNSTHGLGSFCRVRCQWQFGMYGCFQTDRHPVTASEVARMPLAVMMAWVGIRVRLGGNHWHLHSPDPARGLHDSDLDRRPSESAQAKTPA